MFFFISRNVETEVVSCIQCQCLGNIQKEKFNKLVNEKKKKMTGAVFIMIIKNSQLYFIYLFIYFLPKLSIYFTKIVFKGIATINREKHMLKTSNQDNTEIENDFSIEF